MIWILSIIVGIFIGWVAGVLIKTRNQQGFILSIAGSVTGALIGTLILESVLNFHPIELITLWAVISSAIGAVALVIIMKLTRFLK